MYPTKADVIRTPKHVQLPNTTNFAAGVLIRSVGLPSFVANHELSVRLRTVERTRRLAGFNRIVVSSYRNGFTDEQVAPFTIEPNDFHDPTLQLNLDALAISESARNDRQADRLGLDSLALRAKHTSNEFAMLMTDAIEAHCPRGPRSFLAKTIIQDSKLFVPSSTVRTNC